MKSISHTLANLLPGLEDPLAATRRSIAAVAGPATELAQAVAAPLDTMTRPARALAARGSREAGREVERQLESLRQTLPLPACGDPEPPLGPPCRAVRIARAHAGEPLSHRAAIAAWVEDDRAGLAALDLARKPLNESIVKLRESPRGVAVLFHGFNAGPEQWAPYVDLIHGLGFDVFIPALPGHGIVDADGRDVTSLTPPPSRHWEWRRFGDTMLEICRGAGQVVPIGLSHGGQLALQCAARHVSERTPCGVPLVDQTIALAPLLELSGDYEVGPLPLPLGLGQIGPMPLRLGPLGLTRQQASELIADSRCLLKGPIDSGLRGVKVDLKKGPPALDYGARYENQASVLGLMLNAKRLRAVLGELKKLPGGVQLIATQGDDLVSTPAIEALARRIGAEIHVFQRHEGVPHTMTHPRENDKAESIETIKAIIAQRLSRPTALERADAS